MPRLTAAELCARRRREIGALLDLIRERTTTGDMASDTWPVAGSLGETIELLLDVAMYLAGESDEDKARCVVADEIAKRVEPMDAAAEAMRRG